MYQNISHNLKATDLVPEGFNYIEYINKNNIQNLIGIKEEIKDPETKRIFSPTFSVDPNNKIPFPAQFDDLSRLHFIARSRKVTTILEFGVGYSSIILADALRKNQLEFEAYTAENLRRDNLYECHSIDNYESWIKSIKMKVPNELTEKIIFHLSELNLGTFNDRMCTFYNPLPNLCPDLIYLDGPDQFSALGEIRGMSTRHQDRMPMSGDILTFEHFLQPGTLIIVDGRAANSRFLMSNFQREWAYFYSEKWDQHFFELQEDPLGIFNERMIKHCLGDVFFERLKD